MIETIYSNENTESDRTGKQQTSFKMPKNIRQVGKSNATKKIYVEDYVMTFIKQLAGGDYAGLNIAVLVGQCIKVDNCRNIFISGAVKVSDVDAQNDIVFTNDTWTSIYEEIKKYFVETEIVGWFIGGPGYLLTEEDKILKTHIDNFAGQDKILLTYDNLEKEEMFLSYENNRLCKQDGYYIYYEKNEEMQSYIIDHKKTLSIEVDYDDKVSRDIRNTIQKHTAKQEEEESKSVTRLMYAAGTLLAIIVLIVGAAMLRNYDQMKNMQATLNYLTKNMEKFQAEFGGDDNSGATPTEQVDAATDTAGDTAKNGDDAQAADDAGLDVEVVPGNVEPIAEDAAKPSDTAKQNDDNKDAVTDKELADDTPAKDTSKSNDSTDTAKNDVNYYVVKSGDTLADISFKLYKTYTKVNKIMQLNGITDQDLIYEGQKLIVP